mgnify:CR=1 FL=1
MKKIFLICLFISAMLQVKAQNIQLHYDFGRHIYSEFDETSRPVLTGTIEMFKGDKWGSTYFFVDFDYTQKGLTSAYTEISRELKFWDGPFSAHLEYNGGLSNVISFENAYLAGATYTYNNSDFTRGFTLSAMYKYIQKHQAPNNFQITGTWYLHCFDGKFTCSGFADLWREKNPNGYFIFISEPQFWLNLNKFKAFDDKFNLSVGSEIELSHDFSFRDGFYVIPTLALKWTFD